LEQVASAKSKRILALLNDPRNRKKMLRAMNRDNTENVGPVGGQEHEMKVLQEMNEMDKMLDRHIQDIGPKVTVY
jgi:hypothetical protein